MADLNGLRNNLNNSPAFPPAKRTRFLNPHHIARLALAPLVVNQKPLRFPGDLLVQRMHDSPVHCHYDGLLHLIAADHPDFLLSRLIQHYPSSLSLCPDLHTSSGFFLLAQFQFPFPLHRLDPGDTFPKLPHNGQDISLATNKLKPQLKQLLAELNSIRFKLLVRPLPHILGGPFPLLILFKFHALCSFVPSM
jgi:hypothetical protein